MKFYLLNVFTKNKQNGNQLAAVFPEKNLTPEEMQKISREFNFSETIFFDPADKKHLRIFTPIGELPFAGHPTVGGAWLLHHLKHVGEKFTMTVPQGELPSVVKETALIQYPGTPVVRQFLGNISNVLKSCNVNEADVEIENVRSVNAGPVFTVIPLKSRKALTNATLPANQVQGTRHYFYFKEDDHHYSVRMFGMREDPATGSAACALAGFLKQVKGQASGKVILSQGKEMNRECELHLTWDENIFIGGRVNLWGEGALIN
jgi:trans-2,3-dihydro-3-hydroxyanthranilate isomerase